MTEPAVERAVPKCSGDHEVEPCERDQYREDGREHSAGRGEKHEAADRSDRAHQDAPDPPQRGVMFTKGRFMCRSS